MRFRYHILSAALAFVALACSDDDKDKSFSWDEDDEDTEYVDPYEYLKEYKPLKEYLSNNNAKLCVGVNASSYGRATGSEYSIAKANFTEVVAGNEMKYASCINSNGAANFSTVERFINTARKDGIAVYGHTLAWHSQQQPKYLLGLVNSKETEEEKKQALIDELDRWIGAMMEATDGYVYAWDAINEAVSGEDKDKDGKYELQGYTQSADHNFNVEGENFYWQHWLGAENYGPIVVNLARKHFKGNPDDLKLFINDYNLESWWDGNKKLSSLIEWIKIWESDGVTKIDGIGTQMHLSCYENEKNQKTVENSVVKMFQMMKASGKLCRISELDMGYVTGSGMFGSSLKTEELTEEQHKKMAEFYNFIIRKYFEIIPEAQQYGIAQWCATDAPKNSGWRGGEPVGLWDRQYNRKHAYAGFADGLAGKEYDMK